MKNVKTIFAGAIFIMLLSVTAFAGNGSKVIAVVNEASWCPTCQKNGELSQAAFMETNKDGIYKMSHPELSQMLPNQ